MHITLKYACACFMIAISGVSCECYEKLDSNKEVTFLSRDTGGNNGWNTYFDNLLLDERVARNWSIKKYISVAKKYADTVKADLPVSIVCFYGITSCTTPIYAGSDNMRDYEVINIVFTNILQQNKAEKTTVKNIVIWKSEQNFKDFGADEIMVLKNGKISWVKLPPTAIKNTFDLLQQSTVPVKEIIATL